jgi:hypothetical protein
LHPGISAGQIRPAGKFAHAYGELARRRGFGRAKENPVAGNRQAAPIDDRRWFGNKRETGGEFAAGEFEDAQDLIGSIIVSVEVAVV